MASTIDHWNPAWGPRPEWKGPARRPRRGGGKNQWCLVECSDEGCPGAGPWLVYAPVLSDDRDPPERYCCAACGAEMRRQRLKRAR